MIEVDIRIEVPFLTGKSRTKQALPECRCRRYANLLTIERRSTAALCREQLIASRIEHDASDYLVVASQPHRNAEDRETMSEVCGPVQRINIPDEFGRSLRTRSLFADDSVIGKGCPQALDDELLRSTVRFSDYVDGSAPFVLCLYAARVKLHQQSASFSRDR